MLPRHAKKDSGNLRYVDHRQRWLAAASSKGTVVAVGVIFVLLFLYFSAGAPPPVVTTLRDFNSEHELEAELEAVIRQ